MFLCFRHAELVTSLQRCIESTEQILAHVRAQVAMETHSFGGALEDTPSPIEATPIDSSLVEIEIESESLLPNEH